MRRSLLLLLLASALQAMAQQITLNKQRHFPKTVPAGNYSGITWLGADRYAVANDKSPTAGFHLMTIRINETTGDIMEKPTHKPRETHKINICSSLSNILPECI